MRLFRVTVGTMVSLACAAEAVAQHPGAAAGAPLAAEGLADATAESASEITAKTPAEPPAEAAAEPPSEITAPAEPPAEATVEPPAEATVEPAVAATQWGAATTPPAPYRLIPLAATFELGYVTFGIAPKTKRETGVGRGHYVVIGTGAVIYDLVALTVDLAGGKHPDSEPFSQTTTTVGGTSASESKSSLTGWFASAAVGLRTPRIFLHDEIAVTAGAQIGASRIRVTRSISDCVDCREERYKLNSNPFWQALVAFGMGNRPEPKAGFRIGGVGVTYRRSTTQGDLGSCLFVTVGFY